MAGIALTLAFILVGGLAAAQDPDVPFPIQEDDQTARCAALRCAASYVAGLDPNGNGFLAVCTGPGTGYRKIDQIYNGDLVRACARSGTWAGVYCGKPRRIGWIHGKWLVYVAG